MKKNSFYTFLVVFSPVVPALGATGRSFYLFDLFFPFVLLLYSFGRINIKFETIQFASLVACLFFLVFFLQSTLWGAAHSLSVVRFSAIALLIPFLKDFFYFKNFENLLTRFLLAISLLGIFQFVDGFLFNNFFGINNIVSLVYPYPGELSESALAKVDGYQLKSGSFFRATSIADGHPILFGDLVASLSVILLFWKRYWTYGIAAVAVVFTFSRGSWLMLAVGFLIYFLVEFRSFGYRFYFSFIIISCVALLAVLNIEPIYNALYFRVMNTLYTFGLVDIAVGRSNDPRTAIIWPEFFNAMNSIGWMSYLSGYNVGLPTDSGHFAILRESGVVGYLVFLLFSIYSIYMSKFDKRVISMLLVIFIGMIFHPIQQGYKVVYLTSITIAYCIVTSHKKKDIM